MLVMVSAALPVLVSVTGLDALVVFTAWLAYVRLVGDNDTTGAATAVPVPVRLIACGLPAALSTIVIEPV